MQKAALRGIICLTFPFRDRTFGAILVSADGKLHEKQVAVWSDKHQPAALQGPLI